MARVMAWVKDWSLPKSNGERLRFSRSNVYKLHPWILDEIHTLLTDHIARVMPSQSAEEFLDEITDEEGNSPSGGQPDSKEISGDASISDGSEPVASTSPNLEATQSPGGQ